MPEQYVVPQFIDAEDQIFGPITARQFIILMAAFLSDFLFFKLFSFTVFLVFGIPITIFGLVLAFVRVNGQPFHFFILNLIQTLKKPHLRVWDKTVSNASLVEYIHEEIPALPVMFARKPHAESSRLQELSLVVNTGGVYKPEED